MTNAEDLYDEIRTAIGKAQTPDLMDTVSELMVEIVGRECLHSNWTGYNKGLLQAFKALEKLTGTESPDPEFIKTLEENSQ